jgi:hypothetical protein
MRGITVCRTGIALMLVLGTTGCTTTYQAPGVVEGQSLMEFEAEPFPPERPLSPVMNDVYDRSIPADVYSAE